MNDNTDAPAGGDAAPGAVGATMGGVMAAATVPGLRGLAVDETRREA
jgi:hypothetical protein